MKRLIAELEKEIPHIRGSMLNAVSNAVPSHLLDRDLFDFKKLSAGVGDVEAELDLALGHTEEGLSAALISIM
jgi:tRNA 2-thiocytidine biosynthesis protein TtcA